jgi:hypothetical protein
LILLLIKGLICGCLFLVAFMSILLIRISLPGSLSSQAHYSPGARLGNYFDYIL